MRPQSPQPPPTLPGQPIWLLESAGEMNVTLRALVRVPATARSVALAANNLYRIWCDGRFLGHGPARTAPGFARVDHWPLPPAGRRRSRTLAFEVVGYQVPSFYTLNTPPFLWAEVRGPRRALAWTDTEGRGGFVCARDPHRVQAVERYSYQRTFIEGYQFDANPHRWRVDPAAILAAPLVAVDPPRLLRRRAPLPHLQKVGVSKITCEGRVVLTRAKPLGRLRFIHDLGGASRGFPLSHIAWSVFEAWRRLEFPADPPSGPRTLPRPGLRLAAKQWMRGELSRTQTGFIGLRLEVRQPSRVLLIFADLPDDHGGLNRHRRDAVDAIWLDLAPGPIDFESFEPYTWRYLQVAVLHGECQLRRIYLRTMQAPPVAAPPSRGSAGLRAIDAAAVASYRQNTVDVFMDCPSRERAGWLCDSFFTARAEHALTGANPVESDFLENFALPVSFPDLPAGMVPMCYPADVLKGEYIPNWALWYILQLADYRRRGGERSIIKASLPRVRHLLAWFAVYENSDGLLERLPGWVFVEWSRANDLVQDVNYPTNMLYAAALDAAARLLRAPAWRAKAAAIRRAVHEQSWDGQAFRDHALRSRHGRLAVQSAITETCQYYALTFGLAAPRTHRALWHELRDNYGPLAPSADSSSWSPAAAFMGQLLRMELLIKHGEAARARREILAYYGPQAAATGTLWEHNDAHASTNHGFTSYVAVLLRTASHRL